MVDIFITQATQVFISAMIMIMWLFLAHRYIIYNTRRCKKRWTIEIISYIGAFLIGLNGIIGILLG